MVSNESGKDSVQIDVNLRSDEERGQRPSLLPIIIKCFNWTVFYIQSVFLGLSTVLALYFVANMMLDTLPNSKWVYDCTESPDGVCYRIRNTYIDGRCYTSKGIRIGDCEEPDILKQKMFCRPSRNSCPTIERPDSYAFLAKYFNGDTYFVLGQTDKIYCVPYRGKQLCAKILTGIFDIGFPEFTIVTNNSICTGNNSDCFLFPAINRKVPLS